MDNLSEQSTSKEPEQTTAGKGKVDAPVHVKAKGNSILVSPRQRGNPLLKHITSVPWEFDDRLIADYVMGQTTCALYLTIQYHLLNPDYIHDRLKSLGKNFLLRVLIVMINVNDHQHALKALTRISLLAKLTLLPCRNDAEAGKIIERYKIYQFKPPDMIMEKKEGDAYSRVMSALTSVRSVNKTDAAILIRNYGSLDRILAATESSLATCPGFGSQKASRLYKALHQPFLKETPAGKKKSD